MYSVLNTKCLCVYKVQCSEHQLCVFTQYIVLNTNCLCVYTVQRSEHRLSVCTKHPPHLQTYRYSTVTLFTNTHNQTPQLLTDSKTSLFPSAQQFDSAINPIHNYLQFAGPLSNCHLHSRDGDIPLMSLQMLLLPEGRNGTPSEPSNVSAVSNIGQRAVAWCSGSQQLLTSSDLRNYRRHII